MRHQKFYTWDLHRSNILKTRVFIESLAICTLPAPFHSSLKRSFDCQQAREYCPHVFIKEEKMQAKEWFEQKGRVSEVRWISLAARGGCRCCPCWLSILATICHQMCLPQHCHHDRRSSWSHCHCLHPPQCRCCCVKAEMRQTMQDNHTTKAKQQNLSHVMISWSNIMTHPIWWLDMFLQMAMVALAPRFAMKLFAEMRLRKQSCWNQFTCTSD